MEEEWKNNDGPRKVILTVAIIVILGGTAWGLLYGLRRTSCPTEIDPKITAQYGCAEKMAH